MALSPARLRISAMWTSCAPCSGLNTDRARGDIENFRAPALKLTIGYATRGTRAEEQLRERRSVHALQVDISFKEPVVYSAELTITDTQVVIQTYDVAEIIGEKLRALLQQPIRKRTRRQDVFDIDYLISTYHPDADMRAAILCSLMAKADERDVMVGPNSLENTKVKELARAEWKTLKLEIGGRLPDFEEAFELVS